MERLRNELKEVAAEPEFRERLANTGSGEPYVVTPEELTARIKSDYEKYGKLIRSIGVKVEGRRTTRRLFAHPADDRSDDDHGAEPCGAVDHDEHRFLS